MPAWQTARPHAGVPAAAGGGDRQRHRRLVLRGRAQRHARAGGRRRARAGRGRLRPARRRRRRRAQRPAGRRRGRGGAARPGDRGAGRAVGGAGDRRHLLARGRRARRSTPARPAINDIWRRRRREMFELVAERRLRLRADAHRGPAAGRPPGARATTTSSSTCKGWFAERIERAAAVGVDAEQIAIDPGLDFDLRTDDDLEMLRRLGELRALGRPMFVALSRKDFLGAVLAGSWEERLEPGRARRRRRSRRRRSRSPRGPRSPPPRRRGARRDAGAAAAIAGASMS